jgi:hypothetical protein
MHEGETSPIVSIPQTVKRRKRRSGLRFSSRKQILRSQMARNGVDKVINSRKGKNLANDCIRLDGEVRVEEDYMDQGETFPLSELTLGNIEEGDVEAARDGELEGIGVSAISSV